MDDTSRSIDLKTKAPATDVIKVSASELLAAPGIHLGALKAQKN
jgi:hypothetical protein